ncbi:ATP-binding response regulator [Desulforhopalus singaporensis]|uniref:Transcriptional regulator containing PAS, AAA-type ATPase, and DNA-binding Fis domains n=1 Tax=Desulforhopalus singaporensis TaxID=91360 RepID=A0A1H0N4F5_9BACT|nr:sigma 54-interacting transcriptional regulator [Desulforhopalus singaporensis]SDO87385.1 Transcriptional regulator containing PAS, AAA-type ATPase, and DNA-binding Fis domains [Desulforhopalus singaporensis]
MEIRKGDMHILIVDDEESIRITFEMFLKREGYGNIYTAASLEEALALINETQFDLIISDIVLEGATGTELLKYIKQTGVKCPVVMVTGFPNLDSAAEAVRLGAFDYISKPVNKETLLRFVRQAMKHWCLEREKTKLQRENEKFRRYLEVIFGSVSDAIITVNRKMEIIQLNSTARKWIGKGGGDRVLHLDDLPGELGKACFQDAARAVEKSEMVKEHLVECYKEDGSPRIISLHAAPLQDSIEEFAGAVIVARDITYGPPESRKKRVSFHGFTGSSDLMQKVYDLIENVGRVDTAVLVTGESGTGKELAAAALHAESDRRERSLVKVDCAAMAEDILESELFGHAKGSFTGADRDRAGRLMQADRSTLFLDEIGDISPRMQLRLLRFLQEKTFTPVGRDTPRRVDVRIIAATNVDLKKKVEAGNFREDLYYRLKVVEIELPPLRQRRLDIPQLVHHFLTLFREQIGKNIVNVSDQAMKFLMNYRWPGNVRELRHVIERACVFADSSSLLTEHFPVEIVTAGEGSRDYPEIGAIDSKKMKEPPVQPARSFVSEEATIREALQATGGNKSKAAKLLGMDRSTLYRKMKRYQLPF